MNIETAGKCDLRRGMSKIELTADQKKKTDSTVAIVGHGRNPAGKEARAPPKKQGSRACYTSLNTCHYSR